MAAYKEMHIYKVSPYIKRMAVYIEGHVRWDLTKMAAYIDPKTFLYKKVSIDIHVRSHLTIM